MHYYIHTEVLGQTSAEAVAKQLQGAFDSGAAGFFQAAQTASGVAVVFERNSSDDAEYIVQRMQADPACTVHGAAMSQLGDELLEVGAEGVVRSLGEGLLAGKGVCFDFGSGALAELATRS